MEGIGKQGWRDRAHGEEWRGWGNSIKAEHYQKREQIFTASSGLMRAYASIWALA